MACGLDAGDISTVRASAQAIIVSLSQSNAELSRTIRALEVPVETPEAAGGSFSGGGSPGRCGGPGAAYHGGAAPVLVAEGVRWLTG